ncbi:hypothetical protein [Pricia sp.]|uniref:hypothetical protein n=1 Tax=Pricia sp. TaxID=2268138 RepID=UPI00359401CA
MKLKLLLFFVECISAGYVSPDLGTVRQDYRKASESEGATKKMFEDLTEVGKNDDVVLVVYIGAVTTMMAEYAGNFVRV